MRIYGSTEFDPDELLRDLDDPNDRHRFWFALTTLGGLFAQLARRHRRELWIRLRALATEGDTWTKDCLLGVLTGNACLVPRPDHPKLTALALELSCDTDAGLRREATGCLSEIRRVLAEGDRGRLSDRLKEMTEDEDPDVRRFATSRLLDPAASPGSRTATGNLDRLARTLLDPDVNVRISAVGVLGDLGLTTPDSAEADRIVAVLVSHLSDSEPRARAAVLLELARLSWSQRLERRLLVQRRKDLHSSLVAAMNDVEASVYWNATLLLNSLQKPLPADLAAAISPIVIDRLRTGKGGTYTIEAIGKLREGLPRDRVTEVAEILLGLVQSEDLLTARESAFALANLKDLLPPADRERAKEAILTNQRRLRVGWFD